jgi:DNA invertase Pin-like site-specific DNA recombinase
VSDPAPRHNPTAVAVYARVSTGDQNVASQLARLWSSGAFNPTLDQTHTFVDDGVSGSLDSRPAFDRLRDDIRAGAVDVVVAAKLDRIGRSAKTVLEFFDLCEQHGARVVLVDQSIDTGTPAGRLVRTMMAGVAEFEGDLIRERTQQAMTSFKNGTRKTRSGRPVGRPRRVTPEVLQRIREERAKGLTWSIVAQHVGIPAGTCRKVGPTHPSDNPSAENHPLEFGAPMGDP